MPIPGNISSSKVVNELTRRLPANWKVESTGHGRAGSDGPDLLVSLKSPDQRKGVIAVELKREIRPIDVESIAKRMRLLRTNADCLLVAAPYLSPTARERLKEQQISFLDLTGNARIELSRPGLLIDAMGAQADPSPKSKRPRSLRGPKAGRVVRVLVEFKHSPGVREIAGYTGVDAGYVSRLVKDLEQEALLNREGRGRIVAVDWQKLLRRWAEEAPLETRGRQRTYLEPRGVSGLLSKLKQINFRYALTGSLAASAVAPVAPTKLAILYLDAIDRAEKGLGLRIAETGANVLIVEPRDTDVYRGATNVAGLNYVAPSQAVADLLTSPGRGPAEAEELMRWMTEHEDAWRR